MSAGAVSQGEAGEGTHRTEPRVRVLLVDDVPQIRAVLRQALTAEPDMEVVGEAAHGWQAIARTRQLLPTPILMDARMPLLNGIHATRRITAEFPSLTVIGLMIFDNPEEASAMREAGAAISVRKDRPRADPGVMRHCIERSTPSAGPDAQGRAAESD